MTAAGPGALSGVVVADFSRVLAGPYATMMLADLGAEVIKIERPGSGDDTRAWGPPFDSAGTPTYFGSVNRNKRSVALNLADDEGRRRAREIVASADVVIENFTAGTMARLGLGYADLRAGNPGLIYCAITGFGSGGGAALPGYDLLVQAMSGLMSITGPGPADGEPGEPVKVGVAVIDVLTGLHAALGILAALRYRDGTGVGQRVDVDLFSVAMSSLVNQAAGYLGAGVVPTAMGNRHPSIAPYQVFSTATRPLVIAVGNDAQFARLAQVLGRPALATDDRFATNTSRVAHRDSLVAALTDILVTRDADHWYAALTAAGIPAGPINSIADAFSFADTIGLDLRARIPGAADTVANPIRLSATPVRYHRAAPRLPDA
ncbi:MAG: CoA transferase [Gordonia sp. (in: high G+C Gram-positive bacteria)]